ncbi:MAG: acyltransferase family protein [Marinilabiliales bacterium]|nr:acyltransferase family protein [Marinilabiliales bacterium]
MEHNQKELPVRRLSLDQFRGFAIFGMILVNYLNHFRVIPETFKHPRYGMTFANTIAPYFLIAVGMGMRISFVRMKERSGYRQAVLHSVKRYLILILIGMVMYGPNFTVDIWDAFVDIGFAGLLTIPFILASKTVRTLAALLFLLLYQLLFIYSGYGEWTMAHSIDGGPLGPLSWVSILLFGTVLYDYLVEDESGKFVWKTLLYGSLLMLAGLLLSLLEPREWWQISQRSMTVAYPLLSSGIGFVTYLLFWWINDRKKWEIPHLTLLGMNPLLIYMVQNVLIEMHGEFLPATAPLWQALSGYLILYAVCFAVARYLWKNKILIKL